jgi:hypothetical protein
MQTSLIECISSQIETESVSKTETKKTETETSFSQSKRTKETYREDREAWEGGQKKEGKGITKIGSIKYKSSKIDMAVVGEW